jgi:DUF1680 family protein
MQLFSITGDLQYFNEIEKSVYNHLLAAENPTTGCVSYYTPMMGIKPYACHITCCMSSVPRGIAFIPYLNYGKVQNNPTVLLYESANIKDKLVVDKDHSVPVEMQITSSFPRKGQASILVKLPQSTTFTLQLRVPAWSQSFTATINGKTYKGKVDEFIGIKREWKTGDKVSIAFDMPLTVLDGGKSYPGYVAFKRGPQVLSMDKSLNASTAKSLPANVSTAKLLDAGQQLPAAWKGSQAYLVQLDKKSGSAEKLLLVPFADASQTGGEANVWMPATK